MRIFLAMAMAASLFVAAGCSCATGTCDTGCEAPVVEDCNTCEAAPVTYAAPAVTYAAPAPVVSYAAPAVVAAPAPVVMAAPAPAAVAPVITCNPCAGL